MPELSTAFSVSQAEPLVTGDETSKSWWSYTKLLIEFHPERVNIAELVGVAGKTWDGLTDEEEPIVVDALAKQFDAFVDSGVIADTTEADWSRKVAQAAVTFGRLGIRFVTNIFSGDE